MGIITSVNGSVITVCIAGVPGGPNGVETPLCYAQDRRLGDCPHLEQWLLHTYSVRKKKGSDHTALDQRKCSVYQKLQLGKSLMEL